MGRGEGKKEISWTDLKVSCPKKNDQFVNET